MKKILFFLFSLALLILSGIFIQKELNPEWKKYQSTFNKLKYQQVKAELQQAEAEFESPEIQQKLNRLKLTLREIENRKPQIKQIVIEQLDAVDRCSTCHLGVFEAKMIDVAQPYTSHPADEVHEFGKFGCTSCHRGQGRAIVAKEAHGDVENWSKPLLRGKLIQSSCGKCHLGAKIPEAPLLSLGRNLISELGCSGCHQIKGYDGKGENIGADLTDAGDRLKPDWVKRWLKSPRSMDPTAKMPDSKLSDEDVESLTKYLMSLSSKEATQRFEVRMKRASMGKELVEDLGCLGCHEIKSNGLDASKSKVYYREIGPSLTSVGSKLKSNWLKKFLKAPRQIRGGTQTGMPDFRLSDEEANALTVYLMSKSDANSPEKNEANLSQYGRGLTPPLRSAATGQKRFKELGCVGCHRHALERSEGIEGVRSTAIGPELTQIGDKSPDKLDFGTTFPLRKGGQGVVNLKHTLQDWLLAKLKDPRRFSPDAKMPDFRLSDEQAFAITVALMSITNENVPEILRPRVQKEILSRTATGKKLFSEIGCITCHKAEGDRGGELGPFLNHEGSRVKEKWLSDFLKEPQKIRNRIKGRMPTFGLSDEATFALTEYMMTLTDEEMFPKEAIDEEKVTIETLEYGKRLYQEYACFSCHRIFGEGGEKGDIGPDLSRVGSRIKPDWEYIWLKDPPAIIPDTEMEDFEMWDDEAEAITKYLQMLK